MKTSCIKIPAGEFLMGAQKRNPKEPNYDAEARDDESPVHPVNLSAFRIGRYPVTVKEYLCFVEDKGYEVGEKSYWKEGGFGRWEKPDGWREQFGQPMLPVTGVSWYEATAYAAWAGCRLPTEAEWERAARGTTGRKYPWGKEEPNETWANFASDGEPDVGHPTTVGLYPAGDTPEGIAEMAGNVWEWCSDIYDREYYRKSPKEDPRGPGRGSACVLRGGSWFDRSGSLRAACRNDRHPEYRADNFGFRVVCVLSPMASL